MSAPIGFVLLTHTQPEQIRRLVRTLNSLFDRPPIVCHHDFSHSQLPSEVLTDNVSLVLPHQQTEWGDFSLVDITLRALEALHARHKPEWTVILSGSDYPIKRADVIWHDLQESGFDAHIDCKWIDLNLTPEQWYRERQRRYYTWWLRIPPLLARFTPSKKPRVRLKPMWLFRPALPFSKNFRCYSGVQWFSLKSNAVEYVLHFHRSNPKVTAHFRRVMFSDEAYFHTILGNAAKLRINPESWRYIDWSPGSVHPKELHMDDLPNLLASRAHFARKFDLSRSRDLLDELDRHLGIVRPS